MKDSGSKQAPLTFEERKVQVQKAMQNPKLFEVVVRNVDEDLLAYLTPEQRMVIFDRIKTKYDMDTGEEK